MASPINSSAAPSPYIAAVSMSDIPRSKPSRSAAISVFRFAGFSAIRHVPCPRIGIFLPEGSGNVFIAGSAAQFGRERVRVLFAHALSLLVRESKPPRWELADALLLPRG